MPLPQSSMPTCTSVENRAVYVGALDAYKFDRRVVAKLLELDPELEIDLFGSYQYSNEFDTVLDLDESLIARLHYHGPVDRSALSSAISTASFGLIAMTRGRYSDHSFPLKVWDYLACGLPVLAVGSPSAAGVPAGVVSVDTTDALTLDVYRRVRAGLWSAEELRRVAAKNSALSRVERLYAL